MIRTAQHMPHTHTHNIPLGLSRMRGAMSTTILQYFYNKSRVVSYYWFKFKFSTEITFLT